MLCSGKVEIVVNVCVCVCVSKICSITKIYGGGLEHTFYGTEGMHLFLLGVYLTENM